MKRVFKCYVLCIVLQGASTWAQSGSVIVGAKEWLQPSDFPNVTRVELDTVCPAARGRVCSGLLEGIDVTGFVFASVTQVNTLIRAYGAPAPDYCSGSALTVPDSTWVPAILADFAPTEPTSRPEERFLEAAASDADICTNLANSPAIPCNQAGFIGIQSTPAGDGYCGGEGRSNGVWLFRPVPKSVPALGAYGLVCTGLGLMLLVMRRLSRR